MDCARQHLHQSVFTAAKRAGLRIVLIPAKLTWLLQPCDTHVFLRYKKQLRRFYQEERARNRDGRVSVIQWLRMIVRVITSVIESCSWAAAFLEDGFGNGQMSTSRFILTHMEPSAMLPAASDQPSQEVLQLVVPSNCHFAARLLLGLPTRMPPARLEHRTEDAEPHAPPVDHMSSHDDALHRIYTHARDMDSPPSHPGAASSSGAPAPARPAPPGSWSQRPARQGPHVDAGHAAAPDRHPQAMSHPPPALSVEGPISRRTRSRTFEFVPGS